MTKNKYYQFLLATYCKNTFRTKIYFFLFYFYQKIKIISVYFEFIAIYPCLGSDKPSTISSVSFLKA